RRFTYEILSSLMLSFLFFFSSRRRHTRSTRDWSSDVCSSDLQNLLADDLALTIDLRLCKDGIHIHVREHIAKPLEVRRARLRVIARVILGRECIQVSAHALDRSEERRVGQEGGSAVCEATHPK